MDEVSAGAKGPHFEAVIPPDRFAGVWANAFEVSIGQYEFTLDFWRADETRERAILVARVALSSGLMSELVSQLRRLWADYAARSWPKEVRDAEEEEGQGDDPSGAV